MIGYVTIGTNDFAQASRYYDELLGALDAKRIMGDGEKWIVWSAAADRPGVCLTKPFDGKAATVGNGVDGRAGRADACRCGSRLHAGDRAWAAKTRALPVPRGDMFYAGYFRDLDGNKLNVFCMTQK